MAKNTTVAGVAATNFPAQARVLPFLDQATVYQQINFNAASTDPSNAVPFAFTVPGYRCPSDYDSMQSVAGGRSNYYTNYGTIIGNSLPSLVSGGTNFGMPYPNGPLFQDSFVRIGDITDGTSNTAMMSERMLGDGSNAIITLNSDTFEPGTYPPDAPTAVTMCLATNTTTTSTQGKSNGGVCWLTPDHTTTYFYMVLTPNQLSCMYPPSRVTTTANSRHIGGVHLLLCDGSVKFASNNVDINLWQAIGSRNGGEIVGDF